MVLHDEHRKPRSRGSARSRDPGSGTRRRITRDGCACSVVGGALVLLGEREEVEEGGLELCGVGALDGALGDRVGAGEAILEQRARREVARDGVPVWAGRGSG